MSILSNIPEDIRNVFPPSQEGKIIESPTTSTNFFSNKTKRHFSCFGFSLQGDSHKNATKPEPCQDYNNFQIVEGANVVIAAIADGLGSDKLSHWGAFVAVESAIEYTKNKILTFTGNKELSLEYAQNDFEQILHEAFSFAQNEVENLAVLKSCPVAALQSTLTLVIYDGEILFCKHTGDGGVIVQLENGRVELCTKRLKGEEANSVFPLQKQIWHFYCVGMDNGSRVISFVMATDGVLDYFSPQLSGSIFDYEFSQRLSECFNGIYYPFIERAVYSPDGKPRDAKEALNYYRKLMENAKYRERVSDDITFVSVINSTKVTTGVRPTFNKDKYRLLMQDIEKRRNDTLYPDIPKRQEQERKGVTFRTSTEQNNLNYQIDTDKNFLSYDRNNYHKNQNSIDSYRDLSDNHENINNGSTYDSDNQKTNTYTRKRKNSHDEINLEVLLNYILSLLQKIKSMIIKLILFILLIWTFIRGCSSTHAKMYKNNGSDMAITKAEETASVIKQHKSINSIQKFLTSWK